MKHFQNNSNEPRDPRDVTDDQLDQWLSSVKHPAIERKRKRRLKRQLNRLLHSNVGLAAVDSSWTRAAIGVVAICGLAILVFSIYGLDNSKNSHELLTNASHSPSGAEIASGNRHAPEFTPIVSYVAVKSTQANRSRPISEMIKSPPTRLFVSLEEWSNSNAGLDVLEYATAALEFEIQQPVHLRGRETQFHLRTAMRMRERVEENLARQIQSRQTSLIQKRLAFQKLCRCGSSKAQRLIFRYWNDSNLDQDIAVFAKRVCDSSIISQMVVTSHDLELKSELMTELLDRNDSRSMNLFLELTLKHQLYASAQQSGRSSRKLPTQQLLAALQSNRMGIVRAASITLSQVDDPQISESLVELARNPATMHAAVLALTARHDEQANHFLRIASSDLQWTATVATAQRKWSRFLAVN